MRVLVTGATGFIGSHLVPALLARGHAVRVLARATSDLSALPPDVEVARGELDGAAPALQGVDGLVHLAGVSGRVGRRGEPGELRSVNVEGTRSLFEAARAAAVRRAVHVTSMWTMLRPELADRSPYLASRLESERIALALSGDRIGTAIVCPTFVVGAGDRGPNFPGKLIVALARGRMPVVPAGGMTWIAAHDAALAIAAALESGMAGAHYLLGAEHIDYRDLAARVGRITGRSRVALRAPRGLLRAFAAVGDLGLRAADRAAPMPLRDGIDLLAVDRPVDCSRSWRDLGPPAVPVDQAIGEAIAWFGAHGYV